MPRLTEDQITRTKINYTKSLQHRLPVFKQIAPCHLNGTDNAEKQNFFLHNLEFEQLQENIVEKVDLILPRQTADFQETVKQNAQETYQELPEDDGRNFGWQQEAPSMSRRHSSTDYESFSTLPNVYSSTPKSDSSQSNTSVNNGEFRTRQDEAFWSQPGYIGWASELDLSCSISKPDTSPVKTAPVQAEESKDQKTAKPNEKTAWELTALAKMLKNNKQYNLYEKLCKFGVQSNPQKQVGFERALTSSSTNKIWFTNTMNVSKVPMLLPRARVTSPCFLKQQAMPPLLQFPVVRQLPMRLDAPRCVTKFHQLPSTGRADSPPHAVPSLDYGKDRGTDFLECPDCSVPRKDVLTCGLIQRGLLKPPRKNIKFTGGSSLACTVSRSEVDLKKSDAAFADQSTSAAKDMVFMMTAVLRRMVGANLTSDQDNGADHDRCASPPLRNAEEIISIPEASFLHRKWSVLNSDKKNLVKDILHSFIDNIGWSEVQRSPMRRLVNNLDNWNDLSPDIPGKVDDSDVQSKYGILYTGAPLYLSRNTLESCHQESFSQEQNELLTLGQKRCL